MMTISKSSRECKTCKYWLTLEPGIIQDSIDSHCRTSSDSWGKCSNAKFKSLAIEHREKDYTFSPSVFLFKLCVFEDSGAAYILATHESYSCPYYDV